MQSAARSPVPTRLSRRSRHRCPRRSAARPSAAPIHRRPRARVATGGRAANRTRKKGRPAGIGDGRDAECEQTLLRRDQHASQGRRRNRRHRPQGERRRGVAEHAGRVTRGIPLDHAARRVRRGRVDAGRGESRRAEQQLMPGAFEEGDRNVAEPVRRERVVDGDGGAGSAELAGIPSHPRARIQPTWPTASAVRTCRSASQPESVGTSRSPKPAIA